MRSRSIIKNVAAAISCALISACASGAIPVDAGGPVDAAAIGWLHGPCIALADDALVSGSGVAVVVLDEPQRVVAARIGRRAEAADGCPALLDDRREVNLAGGLSFYLVEPAAEGALAIGVPAPSGITSTRDVLDIDGDGRDDTFGHCATSEGIRFFVRAARDGRPLWNGYYPLGYDVQPDCPEALTDD